MEIMWVSSEFWNSGVIFVGKRREFKFASPLLAFLSPPNMNRHN